MPRPAKKPSRPARKRKWRIAILGAGKIGETLARALLDSGMVAADRLTATARHQPRLKTLRAELKIGTTRSNPDAVESADIILVAVKPQAVEEVLGEIQGRVHPGQTVISVVASVPTRTFETSLGKGIPVIRAMPNTPCLLRAGMTAICPGRYAREEHLAMAERIFQSVGRTIRIDESHMDAVTGLSASGPAFIYIVIESLAEGGVKVGLPRDISTQLAAQTVLGAGRMVLDTGEHPAKLRDVVTTPAGCTIDGVLELEDGGLRVALIKAVVRATERARQLADD